MARKASNADEITKTLLSIVKTMECSICIRISSDPVSVGCGHFFCRECIMTVLNRNFRAACPLCMKSYTKRSIHIAVQRKAIGKALFSVIETLKNIPTFENNLAKPFFNPEKTLAESTSTADVKSPDTEAIISPVNKAEKTRRKSSDHVSSFTRNEQEVVNETLSLSSNKDVFEDNPVNLNNSISAEYPLTQAIIPSESVQNTSTKKLSKATKLFHYFEKTNLNTSSDCRVNKERIFSPLEPKKCFTSSENVDDSRANDHTTLNKAAVVSEEVSEAPSNLPSEVLVNQKIGHKSKTLKNLSMLTRKKKKMIKLSKSKIEKPKQAEKSAENIVDSDISHEDDDTDISFDVDFCSPPHMFKENPKKHGSRASNSSENVLLSHGNKRTLSESDGTVLQKDIHTSGNISKEIPHQDSSKLKKFKLSNSKNNNSRTCSPDHIRPFLITSENTEEKRKESNESCSSEIELSPACKSPGWSRIKQMNKDFQFKTVPLLQILKNRNLDTCSKLKMSNKRNINEVPESAIEEETNVEAMVRIHPSPAKSLVASLEPSDLQKENDNIITPKPMKIIDMQKRFMVNEGSSLSKRHSITSSKMPNVHKNNEDAQVEILPSDNPIEEPYKSVRKSPVIDNISPLSKNDFKSSEKSKQFESIASSPTSLNNNGTASEKTINSIRLPSPEIDADLSVRSSQGSFSHRKIRRTPQHEMKMSSDIKVVSNANCKRKRLFGNSHTTIQSNLEHLSKESNAFPLLEAGDISNPISPLKHKLTQSVKRLNQSNEKQKPKSPELECLSNLNFLSEKTSFMNNSFASNSPRDKKIIKRVCLTLEEVQQHFKQYDSTGRTQRVCSVSLPFSELNLELTVSEQTLNVSVYKVNDNASLNDGTNINRSRNKYRRKKMSNVRKRISCYQASESHVISQSSSKKKIANVDVIHTQELHVTDTVLQKTKSPEKDIGNINDDIEKEMQCDNTNNCKEIVLENKPESPNHFTNEEMSKSLFSISNENKNENSLPLSNLSSILRDAVGTDHFDHNLTNSDPCNSSKMSQKRSQDNDLQKNDDHALNINNSFCSISDTNSKNQSTVRQKTSNTDNGENSVVLPDEVFLENDFASHNNTMFSMKSVSYSQYEDLIKESDEYSSDPDMDFARKLVEPLKNIAKTMTVKKPDFQNKCLNQSQQQLSPNQSCTSPNPITNKGKNGSICTQASNRKLKKFRRIKPASSSEDSDSYDAPTQPFVTNANVCDLMTRNQNYGANEITAASPSEKNSSDRMPDEDESILCTDDLSTGAVSKIRQEIEEMDAKIKMLQEKISVSEFNGSGSKEKPMDVDILKFQTAKSDWEEFPSDDSRDSTEIFTEPIPPTPPRY